MIKGIEAAFVATLIRDPSELKQGKTGQYCNFSATVSGEAGESYVNVICFGSVAEELVQRAKKGDSVYVEGLLKLATWETAEGESRSGLAVSATKVMRLGLNGRNRPEGTWPLPEELPLPERKPRTRPPRAFGFFRKKAPPAEAKEESADNGRPFDDKIPF